MSRQHLLPWALIAVLTVPGCAPKSATSSKPAENAAYEREAEQRLAAVDAQIDTLKVKLDAAGANATVEAKQDLADLEVERQKAKTKLDELRAAGAEAWGQTKIAMVAELDTLDAKFDRARDRMHEH